LGHYPLHESTKQSLNSTHTLKRSLEAMEGGLGMGSWSKATSTELRWNVFHDKDPVEFWWRDPITVARWLLRQPCNSESLVYHPEKRFVDGRREYREMNTGTWWWEEQAKVSSGCTVVPILLFSDSTHLTNFAGDKKAWPIYMSIGNLDSTTRMKPSTQSVVMIGLLPQKFKHSTQGPSGRNNEKQGRFNDYIIHKVLGHVLQALVRSEGNSGDRGDSEDRAFYALCADGRWRLCVPRIAGWIADYPEHTLLQGIDGNLCPWCEVPKSRMSEYPLNFPERNHALYARLYHRMDPRLLELGVKPMANTLWWLICNPVDLPKPDVLHTIQLGMLKHLLEWIHAFLKQYNRLDRFNAIWLSIPAYLDMTRRTKAYEEISQWTGKEYKTMSRFLTGCLASTLSEPSRPEKRVFDKAILCTRALCEFFLYCQYPVHNDVSSDSMEDSLSCFHETKDVFQIYRAGKKGQKAANSLRSELMGERDRALQQAKGTSAKDRVRLSWNRKINTEMQQELREHGHFNFPKIHLLGHFRKSIERFGALLQHSTTTTEISHKGQIKRGFQRSNRTGDYYQQILRYNARREAFAIRKLNVASMSPPAQPAGPEEPHVRPATVLGSRQFKDGKGSIRTFVDLLGKLCNDDHRDILLVSMQKFLRRGGFDVSEEGLFNAPSSLYHKLEVHVAEYGTGKWQLQRLRCTSSAGWHNGPPRFDWVWWRADPQLRTLQSRPREPRPQRALAYNALRGRLPVRLLVAFKISLPTVDRNQLQLGLVEKTQAVHGGKADRASAMVRVTRATQGERYQIVHISHIDGAAHLIPFDPKADTNTSWLVNSHIDIETWNEVVLVDEEHSEDGMDVDREDGDYEDNLGTEPQEVSLWSDEE
jgi:hypothetical protein